jgi:chromosome segregation ATPase
MDIRTYPVTPVTLDALRAENERLHNELDAMTAYWRNAENALADAKRELAALRDERPRLLRANVRLFHDANALRAELATQTDNAAELGKALDMALAERDAAYREVDALRAELDAMRETHSVIAGRMEAMGC